ncbi:MAG: oligosaccharide flippase family protein [Pseudomonadota bacterium]
MNNKILKNWSVLTISNLLGQVLGMFATIFVARALLPTEYGYYSLVMIYADMGLIVAALGMRQILIRELSRKPQFARQYLKTISLYQFLVSVPVIIFIVIHSYFSNQSLFEVSGASIGLMYCLLMWQMFSGIAFSHEEFILPALLSLSERMLWLFLLWLAPSQWLTLSNIAFLFVSIQLLKSAILMILVYKKGYIAQTIEKSSQNLIKIAAPIYWVELLVIVTDHLPILFLSSNSPAEQVGYFSASLKLILPIETMIATLMAVIMPSLSKAHGDDVLFKKMVSNSVIAIIVIGIVISFITTLLSDEIIYLIFGENYQAAAIVLKYQIWFAILVAVLDFMGTALIASNNQLKLGVISTIAAAISLPIMWYSSYYGAEGLAIGFLIVGVFNVIYWWPYFQRLHGKPFSRTLTLYLSMALLISYLSANYIAVSVHLYVKIPIVLMLIGAFSYYLYKMYFIKKRQ